MKTEIQTLTYIYNLIGDILWCKKVRKWYGLNLYLKLIN